MTVPSDDFIRFNQFEDTWVASVELVALLAPLPDGVGPLYATTDCDTGNSASAQPAGETRWEADCRRGYIRKAFPKDYPGLEFSDAVRIDILPEEFANLEKAIREMRKCEKFYQCLTDRAQGKVKHCYENDRRWR